MAFKRGLKRGKQQEEEKSTSPSDILNKDYQPLTDDKINEMIDDTVTIERLTQDSGSAHTETATATSAAIVATTKETKHMSGSEPTSLMEFSSDLSEAEAPPPLPVGEYPASIVKAEIKDSAKGNKYLALVFRIEPESYPADFIDGNPEGESLSYNRVVLQDTPQGRYRMRKFLESVGGTLSTRVDPNELMGLTATVGIVHGKWEGETRAEIAKVLAA